MSFKRLNKRLKKLQRNVEDNTETVFRAVAIQSLANVVLSTPVDTGLARGNWTVTLNSATRAVTDDLDQVGAPTISEGTSTINNANAATVIYLTNNLPYISALNDGYSAKAPAGFVDRAVTLGIKSVISNIRLLK